MCQLYTHQSSWLSNHSFRPECYNQKGFYSPAFALHLRRLLWSRSDANGVLAIQMKVPFPKACRYFEQILLFEEWRSFPNRQASLRLLHLRSSLERALIIQSNRNSEAEWNLNHYICLRSFQIRLLISVVLKQSNLILILLFGLESQVQALWEQRIRNSSFRLCQWFFTKHQGGLSPNKP